MLPLTVEWQFLGMISLPIKNALRILSSLLDSLFVSGPEKELHIRNHFPLLDLSWEDLLFATLLPMLSVEDVFRLRAVSRGCHALATEYFCRAKKLDVTSKRNISIEAFRVRCL
jgi:hypothetical protein